MSSEKEFRGTARLLRIDIEEPDELRYWTRTLAVTEEQLKVAVHEIGTQASRVREYLEQGSSPPAWRKGDTQWPGNRIAPR
jgi:hypothetical protein